MEFSVLISVYAGTRANDFQICLDSLVSQTLPADEIVLVQDGPIDPAVSQCIETYLHLLPITVCSYPVNRGLGSALGDGLKVCSHELVARVDSDDRSVPDRFSCQVSFMLKHPTISVVGGFMREVYNDDNKCRSVVRQVPIDPDEIRSSLKTRNPMNHPTVMFRKSAVINSGNY